MTGKPISLVDCSEEIFLARGIVPNFRKMLATPGPAD
jgi:hypothetical protein